MNANVKIDCEIFERLKKSFVENGISDVDRIFALTDRNIKNVVPVNWDRFDSVLAIEPGEGSKSLETASRVWRWLSDEGATRHSLLVNVGGGVVTDLGGFTAATFKRGMRFVNVPTTLLGIADAAIGGKTGIDFDGLKNEIGVFAEPLDVIIVPQVLKTLPDPELRSGFAEVVKMALLTDAGIYESLLQTDALSTPAILDRAMRHAARAKQCVVRQDPRERGIRRILNFGHTAGHAFESYAAEIGCPISHGEAVAHGMLHALELSRDRLGFPAERVEEYRVRILHRYYSPLPFGSEADDRIAELMRHDKKNLADGKINYVLLHRVGEFADVCKIF